MQALTSGRNRFEVMSQFQHMNYVIFEDGVYNLTNMTHPGGFFIMDLIKGQDATKYFYGGYTIEGLDLDPHKHSLYAKNYLSDLQIGKLDFKNCNPLIDIDSIRDDALVINGVLM